MNAPFALEILLRAALWGALAIGAAWTVGFVGRNHLGGSVRAWVWRLALAKMILGLAPLSPVALSLLPPVEKAPQPQISITAAPERKIALQPDSFQPAENLEIAPKTVPVLPDSATSTAPSIAIEREIPEATFEASQPVSPPFRPDWPLIALGFWAIGAIFQAIQLARGYGVARNLRRASRPFREEPAASILAQICARLEVRRAPELAISTAGPLLLGTRRPLILLPEPIWRTWNEAELRLVLAHEIAHHKRADLAWNFLLVAASVLFWFHPLLWIARREWRACSEQACDELTLRSTQAPPALYGALLLRLATQSARSGPAMVGVSEDFALLKGRLMILKNLSSSRKWPRFVVAMVLGAGALSLLPWQLTAQDEVTELKAPQVEGVLRDTRGRIVADAEIFSLGWRSEKPFLHTDRNGYYHLPAHGLRLPSTDLVWIEGKTGGFARLPLVLSPKGVSFGALEWRATSTPKLTFVDENHRPIKNWQMRVWSVGKPSHLRPLPPLLKPRFSGRTNARGEISFPALPEGMTVQLESGDTDWVDTYYGLPNRRGVRFAPLIEADRVALRGAVTRRTIRLLPPATLSGQVSANGGASGVPILARFLGNGRGAPHNARNQLIASTVTDAQGRYEMKGLRPGRYSLWIFPKGNLQPRYTSQLREFTLHSGLNTANLQFTTGAFVEGRVVSATTGKPVAGQTLGLKDPFISPRYEVSRADGTFRFHVAAGKQYFWVAANGPNSQALGYGLPAQSRFSFNLKEGQTKTFLIRLPVGKRQKPIMGRVLGPNGASISHALINVQELEYWQRSWPMRADANGHFALNAELSKRPVRLIARAAESGPNLELATWNSTIALPGENVTLQLRPNALTTLTLRVVDARSRKPLSGAHVSMGPIFGASQGRGGFTDAAGRIVFARLRPEIRYECRVAPPGANASDGKPADYEEPPSPQDLPPLRPGAQLEHTIALRPNDSSITGRVLKENGLPAAGWRVAARLIGPGTTTDAQGLFRLLHVPEGKLDLNVWDVKRRILWIQNPAVGGESGKLIRLTKAHRYLEVTKPQTVQALPSHPIARGAMAPEIAATSWFNSPPLTLQGLRGQVVLLDFEPSPAIGDIKRQFAPRGLRVIGVGDPFDARGEPLSAALVAPFIKQSGMAFPLALGAAAPVSPLPHVTNSKIRGGIVSTVTPRWSATRAAYGATRAVINRAGRVAYAGDSLSEAVSVAAGLLAAK